MATLPFSCSATPLSLAGIEAATSALGVDAATLWTVLAVETAGFGFLGDRRPQILFERHFFHNLTGGKWDASCPGISNPIQGGYGLGGANQYARLAQAVALDHDAALKSASWGLGQVMGNNYGVGAFTDVSAMVGAMCASEDGQLRVVVGFIESKGLKAALQAKNWAAYAKGYNGLNYAENQYDIKLAHFYSMYSAGGQLPDLNVRAGQIYMTYLGYAPQGVDGHMGAHTLTALHNFQSGRNLPLTSGIDAEVVASLAAATAAAVDLSLA